MNELDYFEQRLEGLIAALRPRARKAMAVNIAKKLRIIQQQRIKRQQAPDGTPYAPRKPQSLRTKKGRVKKEMFSKLRTNRYLKAKGDSDRAVVAFTDKVQRIARVHHYGLRDNVSRHNQHIYYIERPLFGLNAQNIKYIEAFIMKSLKK